MSTDEQRQAAGRLLLRSSRWNYAHEVIEASPPPPTVLDAFSAAGMLTRLSGGEGRVFATAAVVFKPADDPVAANWIAETSLKLAQQGLRLARPRRALDGSWVVQSWTAWERITGAHESGCWQEIFDVSDALHAALADVPAPAFLGERSDPWAIADRVAWADASLDSAPSEYVDMLDGLLAARRPLPLLSSQVIHGDLGGNVLFADGLPPAVIDFSPYFRPAGYAKAIVAFDALAWENADRSVLDQLSDVSGFRQLLIRAAAFRVAAAALLSERDPERPDDHGTAPYLRAIEFIL